MLILRQLSLRMGHSLCKKTRMAEKKRGAPPNIALNASQQKKFNQKVHKIKKNVKGASANSGVVYVSHLPWGFEEKPMREYFKQFGRVRQLKLVRSKKTGNSRGFAYIQFAHDEVAKIVAETMNNYLMFGKLIKCKHLVNPHPDTFKNANRKFIKPMGVTGAITKHNSVKTDAAVEKSQRKMLGKLNKLQAKLAAQGIDYQLKDENLSKTLETLKKKQAKALAEKKKEGKKTVREESANVEKSSDEKGADGESDSDDDDDDDDDDDNANDDISGDSDSSVDDTPAPVTPKQKAGKHARQATPVTLSGAAKPADSGRVTNKNVKSENKTNKRQSLVSQQVDTPKGKMSVLIEDSSEDEISFKTPPLSVKSSKLDDTLKFLKGTPVSTQKRSPKRKMEVKTPATGSKKGKDTTTPEVEVPLKKAKFLSKSAEKVKTPKEAKLVKMPKSAQKLNIRKVSNTDRKEMRTPKNVFQTDKPLSGRKSSAKKTLPSETKKKKFHS